MRSVLVLWKKEGDAYRAYSPPFPECFAEGDSLEDVEKKMTEALHARLPEEFNRNGQSCEILFGEDKRPIRRPVDQYAIMVEEMLAEELDPQILDHVKRFNARLTPEMTKAESDALYHELIDEDNRNGKKWFTFDEVIAEIEQICKEDDVPPGGQA